MSAYYDVYSDQGPDGKKEGFHYRADNADGTPYLSTRSEFPSAYLERMFYGKFVLSHDGLVAARSGNYIVFQDVSEGKVAKNQYEIEIDSRGYAKMAGYWICIDQDSNFNLKNEGVWVMLRERPADGFFAGPH